MRGGDPSRKLTVHRDAEVVGHAGEVDEEHRADDEENASLSQPGQHVIVEARQCRHAEGEVHQDL